MAVAKPAKTGKTVSYLDPFNVAAGFQLPEGPYKVVGVEVLYWNYNNEVDTDDPDLATFVRLDFQACDKKGKLIKGAETKEQFMRVAKAIYVKPSKDGTKMIKGPQAEHDTIGPKTIWGFFLTQLKSVCDLSKLGEGQGVDRLVGLCGILEPLALPKQTNVEGFTEDADQQKKREKYGDRTLPVFTKIISYPDGSADDSADDDTDETEEEETLAPKKKAGKPVAAGKKKSAKPADDEEEETEEEESEEAEEEETEEAEEGESEEEEGGDNDAQAISDAELVKFLKTKKGATKITEARVNVFKAKAVRADEDTQKAVLQLWKDPDNYTVAAKKAGFKVVGDQFVPVKK